MCSVSVQIISLCLAAFLFGNGAVVKAQGRIIGGQLTTIERVPYLVQLRYKDGGFLCGGTLVKPTKVVTAAHCFGNADFNEVVVVGGATMTDDSGEQRKISQLQVHPYYNDVVQFTHDVAVLTLESPLEGENIETIELCREQAPTGKNIQVSGWGINDDRQYSHQVRTVMVPTYSPEVCVEKYSYRRMSGTMLCASEPGTKDSCSGDSGGPGVYQGKLCAIVSWGRGCAQAAYPGVYTDVTKVSAFIGNALND